MPISEEEILENIRSILDPTACWNCGITGAGDPKTVNETQKVFCKDCEAAYESNRI